MAKAKNPRQERSEDNEEEEITGLSWNTGTPDGAIMESLIILEIWTSLYSQQGASEGL